MRPVTFAAVKMNIKGYFENLLDRRLGCGKTPNLPSRLVACGKCDKVWNVKNLDNACVHDDQLLANETWMNYLKSLL